MGQTSVTAEGVIDAFLLLLIGIGPKIALVPFLQITAPLDPATRKRVARRMLVTAATVALILIVLGELLRSLLHFQVGSLSIAGGVILFVLAGQMVLGQGQSGGQLIEGKDTMRLAQVPLAVPYLLNPVGIVGLVTISAEARSLPVLAVAIAVLVVVLLLDLLAFGWASRAGQTVNEDRLLIIEKVFGFLLAALAVELVLDGLSSFGIIPAINH